MADYTDKKARSSVGEHYLDTVGVGGSNPPAPTTSGSLEVRSGTHFKNTPVVFRAGRRGLWFRLTLENTLYFLGSPKSHLTSPRSEILGSYF